MKALLGLFLVGLVGLFAMVGATASTSIGGGLLLACALVAGGLNLLRALAGTSRTSMARREGLSLLGLALLSCTALGAATGSAAWRAVAAEQEEKRLADERRIAEKVAQAPSIVPILDAAEEQLAQGKLEASSSQLAAAEARLKPLRGHEALSPLIGQLDQRLTTLTERNRVEVERKAVASAEAAQLIPGLPGLEAMLSAREEVRVVPKLSASAKLTLAALEEKLALEALKTGALSQPPVVLEAHLFATNSKKSGEGYPLAHLNGARGLASVSAGKCTSLYLAAEPRPGALSDSAATAFVELSVGPLKATPLWKAPAGTGPRTATRTHNGVAIHEGWFDSRLVELWAGDFKP